MYRMYIYMLWTNRQRIVIVRHSTELGYGGCIGNCSGTVHEWVLVMANLQYETYIYAWEIKHIFVMVKKLENW